MDQSTADKCIQTVEDWWQERRNCYAMSNDDHTREAALVAGLKAKFAAMVEPEPAKSKK